MKVLDADSHRLLSIVEIKRDEEAESQAIEQVIKLCNIHHAIPNYVRILSWAEGSRWCGNYPEDAGQ